MTFLRNKAKLCQQHDLVHLLALVPNQPNTDSLPTSSLKVTSQQHVVSYDPKPIRFYPLTPRSVVECMRAPLGASEVLLAVRMVRGGSVAIIWVIRKDRRSEDHRSSVRSRGRNLNPLIKSQLLLLTS